MSSSHQILGVSSTATHKEIESAYKTLGVSSTATLEEITTAFRKLALIFHPDKNKDNSESFLKISAAYQILITELPKTRVEEKIETPLEDFSLPDFWRKFRQLAIAGNTEELQAHLHDNIGKLQQTISIKEIIHNILIPAAQFENFNYALLKEFDALWLRNRDDLKDTYNLAMFLMHLPLEHWEMFFNYMDNEWLSDIRERTILGLHIEDDKRIYMNIMDYLRVPHDESATDTMQRRFFDFLTVNWLRELFSNLHYLADFLGINQCYGRRNIHFLLTYLDGNGEQWIRKNLIINGTHLGIIFNQLTNGDTHTIQNWNKILDDFCGENWKTKFADLKEINAILKELQTPYAINIFLQTYINKNLFQSYDNLVSVLSSSSVQYTPNEEKPAPHYLSHMASIQVIKFLGQATTQRLMLEKSFDDRLVDIDQHKDKPCYRALLYAMAIAYNLQRNTEPAKKISRFTATEKEEAAKALMFFIENNRPIDFKWRVFLRKWEGYAEQSKDYCLYFYYNQKLDQMFFGCEGEWGKYTNVNVTELPPIDKTEFKLSASDPESNNKKFCDAVLNHPQVKYYINSKTPTNTKAIYDNRLGKIAKRYQDYYLSLHPNLRPTGILKALGFTLWGTNEVKLPQQAEPPQAVRSITLVKSNNSAET